MDAARARTTQTFQRLASLELSLPAFDVVGMYAAR
jgi:hypothetical protein